MQSTLSAQLSFAIEIDKLKHVLRKTYTGDAAHRRPENSAEHSWHLALMVVLLAEHADTPLDVARTVKLALVHDLVEIDAGDTYCYDEVAALDKDDRERRAADRLFELLPATQAKEFRALWDEFEARQTPEAKFANAIDRVQPLLLNYAAEGQSWRENGITRERVLARNQPVAEASAALWDYVKNLLDDAVKRGFLADAK